MSRNLRRKSPQTAVPAKSRRSSKTTTDNSSDDDYGGVDLISDSEEDEPDVEGAEEQAIIESEEDQDEDDDDDDLQAKPRPTIEDDEASWEGFESSTPEGTSETFFDEHMARMNAAGHTMEAAIADISSTEDDTPTGKPRRVRFDISESDNLDSDSDDPLFPDIFLDQNSLDPGFRRIIENDDEQDQPMSDDGFWDSNGSDGGKPVPTLNGNYDSDTDCSGSTGSSGYETDEGETTEEDLPPAAKFLPARSVLRRLSDSSEDEEEITVTRRGPPPRHRGPRLASWIHDASKSFAVLDSHGKKLIMFKATVKRNVAFNSGTSPAPNPVAEGDPAASPMEQLSPMISNSGNLMLSAMYTPLDQYVGQALGPPEAFLPFTSISADGTVVQDSTSSFDDEDDLDDEDLWNVEDFLNFGGGSSDSENDIEDDQDPSPSSDTAEPSLTPARPGTAASDGQVHPLLNHFNSNDVVGAFRRNQNRHQLLTRNAVSHEALAFSGPFGQGTLRGIKGGRLAAANSPMTPMRKQKIIPPLASSPASPLAKMASVNGKRKLDGDYMGHKHKRSRSDL